jgi:hypothetical protein
MPRATHEIKTTQFFFTSYESHFEFFQPVTYGSAKYTHELQHHTPHHMFGICPQNKQLPHITITSKAFN